jgi:serine O-acetyltransferase
MEASAMETVQLRIHRPETRKPVGWRIAMADADHHSETLMKSLAGSLAAAFDEYPGVVHLDCHPLPNRAAVAKIVADLRELLFPGFGERQNLERATLELYLGDLSLRIHDALSEQISRSLRHDDADETCAMEEYRKHGRTLTEQFLATLPELVRLLHTDVIAAFEGDPAARGPIETAFCYPGVEAVTIYRIAHQLHLLGVPLIPRLMTEIAHSKTGIDIHPGASIGPSFFIDHGTGVVVGETTDIGRGVKLYQGVTLGALSFPRDDAGRIIRGQKRHPTLEDDVVVYANATILGGETVIGRGSVVGSSVWLTQSVDPGTMVTLRSPELQFRNGKLRA